MTAYRVPLLAYLVVCSQAVAGPILLTSSGSAYTQNFNSLASSGTSSSLPGGWELAESGAGANDMYTAGIGAGTTGDSYSFGRAGEADRALGTLSQLQTLNLAFGAQFKNDTGGTISKLDVALIGEQWRRGTTNIREDRLDFEYSLDATSLTSGTWAGVTALDIVTATTIGGVNSKDGNLADNRRSISGAITSLSIPNGATFWFRWTDINVTGGDDGLAVDDFSLIPTAAPAVVPAVVPTPAAAFGGLVLLAGLIAHRKLSTLGWSLARSNRLQ